jgi:hypothetical protein
VKPSGYAETQWADGGIKKLAALYQETRPRVSRAPSKSVLASDQGPTVNFRNWI